MSQLIPQRTVDALRNIVDVTLGAVGIDCSLYIPTNTSFDEAEKLDAYAAPDDYEYTEYTTKVYIEWKPDVYRLKRLGLFTEGIVPIVAWFGNKAIPVEGSPAGEEVSVDICIKSYFRISPQYIPNDYQGTEEFEIVNMATTQHDMVVRQMFIVTPRRVKS